MFTKQTLIDMRSFKRERERERERERKRGRLWRFWENFRSLVSNKREKVVGLVGLNFKSIVIARPVGIL